MSFQPDETAPQEGSEVADSLDIKMIISLLESDRHDRDERQRKTDASFEHLHTCIHSIDENIRNSKSFFMGIEPQEHILHHARIEENAKIVRDMKKAAWAAAVSVIFTALMAFMSWTGNQAQKDIQAQIAEIIKQQAKAQK